VKTRLAQRQQGYVLVMVMVALALIALVAARFAARIDELRAQSRSMAEMADARVKAASAMSAGLYVIATESLGPAGFGPALKPRVAADGRSYVMPDGASLSVQDMRGLMPLNAISGTALSRLLLAQEIQRTEADSMIDVLQDYIDIDDLKRLNGAEREDYVRLKLQPPRNDWLLSVRELRLMPVWREHVDVLPAIERLTSESRQSMFNPNTAPRAVLSAMVANATPEQIDLFYKQLRIAPFIDGLQAKRATGLVMDGDDFVYYLGEQHRVQAWAPGLPQALQYNVMLTPGGLRSPWQITAVHLASRPASSDATNLATAFPLTTKTAGP